MPEDATAAQRYTLEEARRELARQECTQVGHSWDVIETFGRGPSRIVCRRCGKSHDVALDADTGTSGANRRT